MGQTLGSYIAANFPTYEARPLDGSDSIDLGEHSVVATFETVDVARAARGGVPVGIEGGVVELADSTRPGSTTLASDSSAAAKVRPWRNSVAVAVGALLGGLIALGVGILFDIDPIAVGFVTGLGVLLGALVAFYSAGMGWFRGERSDAERLVQSSGSIGLLAAVPADEHGANELSRQMMEAGAVEVRIVDSAGFWHAPNAD